MTIDTLYTGFGDPNASKDSPFGRIARIEAMDVEYAEVGLDLPQDVIKELGKLVAAITLDVTPKFRRDLTISPDEPHPAHLRRENERPYGERAPISIGGIARVNPFTDAPDLSQAA